MAKVYLVSFGDHECGHTAGIFSTREKAVEAGDKVEETLKKLDEMYKIRTFEDIPKDYQEAMLEHYKTKENIPQEDIDYWGANKRRKITEKDSLEHQELDKKFGKNWFYKDILPGYSIEEYDLDVIKEDVI
jgi:hypothetical protein